MFNIRFQFININTFLKSKDIINVFNNNMFFLYHFEILEKLKQFL